jgi:hypothetical protein
MIIYNKYLLLLIITYYNIIINYKRKIIMKGIKMNKEKENKTKKDKDKKIKKSEKTGKKVKINIKENIKKIFKNDKIVFLTNIITYVMFAIIVYLMQNSIVQEIKLGQRNNTCK